MLPNFPEKKLFDLKWYNYYIIPRFEFDPVKSDSNRIKHGINFLEAQKLWKDEYRRVLPVRSESEPREGMIGRIGADFWTCIFTNRGDKVRLISARRARHDEKELYRQSKEDYDRRGI